LNITHNYLSDILKNLTGKNTQEHIHAKVIDQAKELLATFTFSVGEIAYSLGFEYPQSLNKLFKNKTGVPRKYF